MEGVIFELNDLADFDLSGCVDPYRLRLETFETGIKEKFPKSCSLNILKFKVFSYVF